MSEKELFVENPLAIAGLFGKGVFLPVAQSLSSFQLVGQCKSGILHLVCVSPQGDEFQGSCNTIHKIMSALVIKGKQMQPADYGILNLETLKSMDQISVLFNDLKPSHVVFWLNQWNLNDIGEIPFYTVCELEKFNAIRCHDVITVLSDVERKQQCWSSVKALLV